jgi:quercetin dioxygenase-like cupin family protein
MKIKKDQLTEEVNVNMEGAKDVTMKILIGPDDGSGGIIMRYFTIQKGGHTPFHIHPYEHVIKVEKGAGVAVDESGKENTISAGESLFVKPDEKHQFKNTSEEPLEIVCVIPNPEKKGMC